MLTIYWEGPYRCCRSFTDEVTEADGALRYLLVMSPGWWMQGPGQMWRQRSGSTAPALVPDEWSLEDHMVPSLCITAVNMKQKGTKYTAQGSRFHVFLSITHSCWNSFLDFLQTNGEVTTFSNERPIREHFHLIFWCLVQEWNVKMHFRAKSPYLCG